MTGTVSCSIHGDQQETFVCKHILLTLKDDAPRGFIWTVDEEGGYQAFCESCDESAGRMTDDEWDEFAPTIITLLCFRCFETAATKMALS